MRTFSQEFHLAFRQLRRLPGIAATAVLALALGIGATAAIFSIVECVSMVECVVLRPLSFRDPSRLVVLGDHVGGKALTGIPGVPAPEIRSYAHDAQAFESTGDVSIGIGETVPRPSPMRPSLLPRPPPFAFA